MDGEVVRQRDVLGGNPQSDEAISLQSFSLRPQSLPR